MDSPDFVLADRPSRRAYMSRTLSFVLTLIVPLLGCLVLRRFFGNTQFFNEPLHSSIEVVGAGIAMLTATVLWFQSRYDKDFKPHLYWVLLAFLCMGTLDFFHALTAVNPAFYWSRTLASLFGGFLFSGIWFSTHRSPSSHQNYVILFILVVGVLSTLLGLSFLIVPNLYPLAFGPEGYSAAAKWINLAGGIAFLVATANFLMRYRKEKTQDHFIFALHCLVFGMAGILFALSAMWDSVWWFFHVARLAAYLVVLIYVFQRAQDVYFLLLSRNRMMEERVEKQTQAIKAREHRLNAIIMNSPSVLSVKDAQGLYLIANPNFERVLGLHPEAMMGKTDFELFPENVAKQIRANDAQVLQSRQRHTFEETLPHSNGTLRTLASYKFPITDMQGTVESICSISLDITESKRSDAERERLLIQLQLALSNAQMGTWIVNLETSAVTLSEESHRLFGMPQSANDVDQTIDAVIHPADRAQARKELAAAIANQSLYKSEYRIIRPIDGQERWILATGRARYDEKGKPYIFSGVIMDITSRKKAEQELLEAIRARDEFLSIASHELKTPLTTLTLQVQARKRSMAKGDLNAFSPENATRYLDQSEKQIKRIAHLVDDMLDITRIRSGKLALNFQEFEICDLVRESIDRLRPQFLEAGISPEFTSCEPARGFWDYSRLEQVIINLLTNAIRYGKGKPIQIQVTRNGERVTLSVRDEGIGISKESQSRIFNRFERAVSANEISGLGLGLYIVRQIVQAHGGKIWVESELNHGSTFFVELPLQPQNQQTLSA